MKFPLVALILIVFTPANFVKGADAKSPDQGEPAASLPPSAPVPAKRVVVWDGEQASKGAGWVNPKRFNWTADG